MLLDDIWRWLGRRRCRTNGLAPACAAEHEVGADKLRRRQAEIERRLAVIEAGGRLVRAAKGASDGGAP